MLYKHPVKDSSEKKFHIVNTNSATTFSIMTLSLMTLSITTFSIIIHIS